MSGTFFDENDEDAVVRREEARLMRAQNRLQPNIIRKTPAAAAAATTEPQELTMEQKEENRLAKAQGKAPVHKVVHVEATEVLASHPEPAASSKISHEEKLASVLKGLDPATAAKVLEAQSALQGGEKGGAIGLSIPTSAHADQLKVFEDPVNPEKISICSFTLKGTGSADVPELDTVQASDHVTITPKPSKWETICSVVVEGKKFMVRCEHKEIHHEDNKKITETVTNVLGITFPFQINAAKMVMRPNLATGALIIEVPKPIFG